MKEDRISTGNRELDSLLNGGLIPQMSVLIKGGPGSGKTTLGNIFLSEGAKQNESTVLISLGETADSIRLNASRLNIDLSDTHILDLSPGMDDYGKNNYSVFSAVEVEAGPIIDRITNVIKEKQPKRVVIDSLTMLKYIYSDQVQYKNMALSLIRFICSSGATLMLISETHSSRAEEESEFWVDGVIELSYKSHWRRLKVLKFRGSGHLAGAHSMKINDDGVHVYPRLAPGDYRRKFTSNPLSSGIDELDEMLTGGIEKGTTTMITGPTGVGKTNLGIQFLKQTASRNERSVMYSFEESVDVITKRSKLIGVPVQDMIDSGSLEIKSIEPFSYSPDEFSMMIRKDIEQNKTKMVIIDSIGGYGITVREENTLEHLHALCRYMSNVGVTSFLISETTSVVGNFETTSLNASYLADNILFLRYLEIDGSLKKSIGILKKRLSDFEKTIREFSISSNGLSVGKPLLNMRGILSGNPEIIS